jgi:hypothetical protein
MGLETGTYISDLVAANPVGATDPKSAGDNHIRLLKATILATFAAITGAVTASHTELNNLAGVTGKTGTGNVVLSASPTLTGTVTAATVAATTLTGAGSGITSLNASNLASGTVPDARFPATLPAMSGVNLTALNASNLASGTVPDARFPATLPAMSGVNLTALNGSNVASGTVADARLSAKVLLTDGAQVVSGTDSAATNVGYRGLPRVTVSGNVTLDASYNGKQLYVTGAGAQLTLPGIFEGFSCVVVNNSGGNITFLESSTAIYLAGGSFGSHGTRTLAYSGVGHVQTLGGATAYILSGTGMS